jgi:hypothetical protein
MSAVEQSLTKRAIAGTGAGPVLLLGGGRGEATCGILYLAGFLRRNGVEAFVRLCDWDQNDEELTRSLKRLMARAKPSVVGISLKWYLHVHRSLVIARAIKRIDPKVRVVLGGNSAALWWRELLSNDCIDDVVMGDGEVPFLALCRGDEAAPNRACRGPDGSPAKVPFGYVQTEANEDVFYSHFDDIFLSQLDMSGFSGWIAPGKGCDQSCVYCGGRRAAQRLSFGRPMPFLRSPESVRKDHRELASKVWQYRYDFPGGSTEYLCDVWPGLDLSKQSTTYFLWGVPAPGLVASLSKTFHRAALVLDIGCFSQTQRLALMAASLLKPCPTDDALFATIDDCLRYPNLELEVSGIAGLPMASAAALDEEQRLMEQVIARGCKVSYQRLQSQPGALVTSHAERFGMVSEAVTFDDFVAFFAKRKPGGSIPMVRFRDPALEKSVSRNCLKLDQLVSANLAAQQPALTSRTKLVTSTVRREVPLGEWLGSHVVPTKVATVPVAVLRSANGAGMACAPTLDARAFEDSMVQHGEAATAVLETLAACARPTTVDAATSRLMKTLSVDESAALEVVEHLVSKHFVSRV